MMKKRACDLCHRKKIQCESAIPGGPCDWCKHHDVACTFSRNRGRQKITKLRETQDLSERIARIEKVLLETVARLDSTSVASTTSAASTPSPLPSSSRAYSSVPDRLFDTVDAIGSTDLTPPNITNNTSTPIDQTPFPGYHLGQIGCYNGIPNISGKRQEWIFSRTGVKVSFSKFHRRLQQHNLPFAASKTSSSVSDLPVRTIVEKCLEDFTNSAFRLAFPVIDHFAFQGIIDYAYKKSEDTSSVDHFEAQACVFAFLSIACRFQGGVKSSISEDGDDCASRAVHLLLNGIDNTSIVTVQTLFMLYLHQTFSGRSQSAFLLHASACRGIFMLGGHVNLPTKPYSAEVTKEEREIRHLRMLFWLCFMSDKDISLRTGQPPIMCSDYCDVTPPDNYKSCYSYLSDLDAFSSGLERRWLMPYLPNDPELTLLKDKACRLLYSIHSQESVAGFLRSIRELDDEVEAWRLSIPSGFRPALSISGPETNQILFPNSKLPRDMRHIGLHLEYHHLMTIIHGASEGCSTKSPVTLDNECGWNSVIHSSTALAVEASRSMLCFLEAAVSRLAGESFWFMVFYLMAAIMTIFYHILEHPLDHRARLDLELLADASRLFGNMPTCKATTYEAYYIDIVKDFMSELIQLGKCAIMKAEIEEAST